MADVNRVGLEHLPNELLEYIFRKNTLTFLDICRLSRVCQKFNAICKSNEIWKRKSRLRWPQMMEQVCNMSSAIKWNKMFKERYVMNIQIKEYLSTMSHLQYKNDELSVEVVNRLLEIASQHNLNANFVLEELELIMQNKNRHLNLTLKYYTAKILQYLRHNKWKEEWLLFLSLSEAEQSLEKGAFMISQWCHPTENLDYKEVQIKLDQIANLVQEELLNSNRDKHIANNIKDGAPDPVQSRVLLEYLNVVMFSKLRFHGNTESYYEANNSYINEVLDSKKGIPITLCIVYQAVARRLGIALEPVGFPSHFLLRWLENPLSPNDQLYTYIDVFNRGKFMPKEECALLIPSYVILERSAYSSISPIKVFQRMVQNLVEVGRRRTQIGDGIHGLWNALELMMVIKPEDINARLLLSRVYLHLNINHMNVLENLQIVSAHDPEHTGVVAYMTEQAKKQQAMKESQLPEESPLITHRSTSPEVEFAIGMVMKHKKYDYMCVIYGWDAVCGATKQWMQRMGVENLTKKQHQPFYNVLVEDGSHRYAAQENLLMPTKPTEIPHPEIGRFFQEFRDYYYVPNPEKHQEYPEDLEATEKIIVNFYRKQVDLSSVTNF